MKTPSPRKVAAVASAPLTFQGRVEKWFLPVLFVLISGVMAWTLVSAYMSHGK